MPPTDYKKPADNLNPLKSTDQTTKAKENVNKFTNLLDKKEIDIASMPSDNLPGWDQSASQRLESTSAQLKSIEWLQPENWQGLDNYQKMTALNQAGEALSKNYDVPNPPVLTENWEEHQRGAYGDGYKFNQSTGYLEGADYGMKMNEKLLGQDPAAALETYAHEFRHAYQAEQANCHGKPQFQNFVHNQDAAGKWSDNLKNYLSPDIHGFDAYSNQLVERDARAFAQAVVKRVYG